MSTPQRKARNIAPRPEPSSVSSRAGEDGSRRRTHTSGVPSAHRSSAQESSTRSHRSGRGSGLAASDRTSSSPGPELPSSVRNAPLEMRKPIRRKQNNESAKRGRERKQIEDELVKTKEQHNTMRIKQLETQVSDLEDTLKAKRNARKNKAKGANIPGEFFEEEKFFGDRF